MSTQAENIALLETIAEYQESAQHALLVQHSVRQAIHYLKEARRLTARLLNEAPLTRLTEIEAVGIQREASGLIA